MEAYFMEALNMVEDLRTWLENRDNHHLAGPQGGDVTLYAAKLVQIYMALPENAEQLGYLHAAYCEDELEDIRNYMEAIVRLAIR